MSAIINFKGFSECCIAKEVDIMPKFYRKGSHFYLLKLAIGMEESSDYHMIGSVQNGL